MGKDTAIRPIRLDSHELLLECARFAGELAPPHCDSILVLSWIPVCTYAQCATGLDMEKATRVLEGELVSEEQIYREVEKVHAAGINSIPQLVFDVEGMAQVAAC